MRHRPLILVSAKPSADLEGQEGDAPRLDFMELAKLMGADLLHSDDGAGRLESAIQKRMGVSLHQALQARRRGCSVAVSLSEDIGAPMAWLRPRGARHVMVAHNLAGRRSQAFQKWTPFLQRVDKVIVLSRAQERYLIERGGVSADKVRFLYDKVDHRFFQPGDGSDDGYLLSVGLEQRDYATLIDAVRPLDVPLIMLPSSAWLQSDRLSPDELPRNVDVRGNVTYTELRRLYDRAALVVIPLRPHVRYAAGVNSVLEAMAMRTPLIVSRTPGLEGYVEDGKTGRWAPAEDAKGLREVILATLSDRAGASRMAERARRVVDEGRNLDRYVKEVAHIALESPT